MEFRVIINGKTHEFAANYAAVIDNTIITANTFSALKRIASIEANKHNRVEDVFYLLSLPGLPVLTFRRRNKKAPNGEIMRGEWR